MKKADTPGKIPPDKEHSADIRHAPVPSQTRRRSLQPKDRIISFGLKDPAQRTHRSQAAAARHPVAVKKKPILFLQSQGLFDTHAHAAAGAPATAFPTKLLDLQGKVLRRVVICYDNAAELAGPRPD
jgi:hypothetical protein